MLLLTQLANIIVDSRQYHEKAILTQTTKSEELREYGRGLLASNVDPSNNPRFTFNYLSESMETSRYMPVHF